MKQFLLAKRLGLMALALSLAMMVACTSVVPETSEETAHGTVSTVTDTRCTSVADEMTATQKGPVTTTTRVTTTSTTTLPPKITTAKTETVTTKTETTTTETTGPLPDFDRPQSIRPGLYTENGVIMLDDKPFYGIGVNYYEMATARFSSLFDAGPAKSTQNLAGYGIPYVRVKFSAWGNEGMSWFWNDREIYWKIMDEAVALAEQHHIGIIATVAWTLNPYISEGETAGRLMSNPDSEGYQKMLAYMEAVITRYRNSPAIWGWEIGNEYNLAADLQEDLSADVLAAFYEDITPRIAKWDGYGRLILHGHSQNRSSAYNLFHNHSWATDDLSQMREMLELYLTEDMGGTSIHVYNRTQLLGGDTVSLSEYLGTLTSWCKEAGKPLIIGEYCDDEIAFPLTDTEENRKISLAKFKELHQAVLDNDIQLAIQWMQSNAVDVYRNPDDYHVTMLKAAQKANADFVAIGKQDTKHYWETTHSIFYQE